MKSHNEKGFSAYKSKPGVIDQLNQGSSKDVNVFHRPRHSEDFGPIELVGDETVDDLMLK